MISLKQTSRAEFERTLVPERLRLDMILQTALLAGPFVFAAIALSLPVQAAADTTLALAWVGPLGAIHLALAMGAWLTAPLFERLLFRPKQLERWALRELPANSVHAPGMPGKCLALLRMARILRLSMYEAPSLLGVVVLFFAHQNGLLRAYPYLWINVASLLALLARAITCWPSKARVMVEFDVFIAKN